MVRVRSPAPIRKSSHGHPKAYWVRGDDLESSIVDSSYVKITIQVLTSRQGNTTVSVKESLAQTLVTRGHSLSLLTESFLSGHRYTQLSNFLAQIGTRTTAVSSPSCTMAESFPVESTILDDHLRAWIEPARA